MYINIIVYLLTITVASIFFLHRNRAVFKFRHKVNNLSYQYSLRYIDNRIDGWQLFFEKLPSYHSMIFSFKKLELESYFDQETIEKLLN